MAGGNIKKIQNNQLKESWANSLKKKLERQILREQHTDVANQATSITALCFLSKIFFSVFKDFKKEVILTKSINDWSFDQKLSRGEICVKNFIPPANGASLGSYFCVWNLSITL